MQFLVYQALILLERITPSIPKTRAVLLSDSRSVLEKLEDSKGEQRQYLAKCLGNVVRNTESLVLQWIPAHCRIEGNERADRLAKEGSELEQIESDLTYREVKSKIKTSLNNKWKESHPEYNKQDGVYCLNRRDQTTIFRLRTGHNRLKYHIHKIFKVGETDLCSCGQAAETAQHVLQESRLYSNVRQSIWRERVDMHTKLYGPLPELEKTVAFIAQAGIGIWRERRRTRRRRRRSGISRVFSLDLKRVMPLIENAICGISRVLSLDLKRGMPLIENLICGISRAFFPWFEVNMESDRPTLSQKSKLD